MEPSPALEHFATLRQPLALQQEIRALSKARAPHAPAIHLTKCLLLGIRRLRQAYQARLDAWIHLCRIAIPPSLEGDAQAALHPPRQDAASVLRTWLATPPGQSLLTELRWALLRPPAALARLRAMGPCGRLADSALLAALAQHGTAVLQDSAPAWCDPQLPTWHDAVAGLAQPFCPQAIVQRLFCCWTCGGAAWPPAGRNPSPCPFCKASVGVPCASCNCILHSRTQCRWNYGAHPAYLRPDAAPLCPDCWLMWARCLQACPLRRRPPPLVDDLRYSTSGSLPTLAKHDLAPRQLSPPCCGLSTFGGGYWLTSANAVAQISTACNMPWPPAARLTRRTAPPSGLASTPRGGPRHPATRLPCAAPGVKRMTLASVLHASFWPPAAPAFLPFFFLHAKIMLAYAFSSFPFSFCRN